MNAQDLESSMTKATTAPAPDTVAEQWTRRSYVTAAGAAPATTPHPAMRGRREAASSGSPGREIAVGVILMVIGVAVTVGTYRAADGGGHYMLAWGPIVFGFISLVRGLSSLGQK